MERLERCGKCGEDHVGSAQCRKLSRRAKGLHRPVVSSLKDSDPPKEDSAEWSPVDYEPIHVGGGSDVIFMERSARVVAYDFGARQRRNNVPRSEAVQVSELVYSSSRDCYLRQVTLEGYDEQDAELAAEMS